MPSIALSYSSSRGSVYVEGKLQTRKWQDQTGQDRYTTEVVVSGFNGTLQMLDRRNDSNSGASLAGAVSPLKDDAEFDDNIIPF